MLEVSYNTILQIVLHQQRFFEGNRAQAREARYVVLIGSDKHIHVLSVCPLSEDLSREILSPLLSLLFLMRSLNKAAAHKGSQAKVFSV